MPFSVRMPDGTVIENIPDGTSKEEVRRKYENMKYAEAGIPTRADDRASLEQALQRDKEAAAQSSSPVAAYQSGAARLGRGVAQMLLPKSAEQAVSRAARALPHATMIPDFESGEFEASDRALAAASPKSHMAGEVIPTLGLPGSTLPRAVATGAATSAALSGPEERATGGVVGGALGGAINALTRGTGRLLGRGIAPMSPEARQVQEATKAFIPARQAVDELAGGGRTAVDTVYGILEELPIAGTALKRQARGAEQKLVEQLLRTAEGGRSGASQVAKALRRKARPATAADIAKAGQRAGAGRGFQDLAESAEKVFGVERGSQSLARRNWFYDLMRVAGETGTFGVGRLLASEVVQNFILGNTAAQRALTKALEAGNRAGVQQTIESIIRQAAIAEGGAQDYATRQ